MVGILVSFSEGLFSGAMLVSWRVHLLFMVGNILGLKTHVLGDIAQTNRFNSLSLNPCFQHLSSFVLLFFFLGVLYLVCRTYMSITQPIVSMHLHGNIVGVVEKVSRRRNVNFQRWTCPSFHDRRRWHLKKNAGWWMEVEGLGWVGYVGFWGESVCKNAAFRWILSKKDPRLQVLRKHFGTLYALEIRQMDTWNDALEKVSPFEYDICFSIH